jgi:outer membrane protein OmpA-like peptidoglycan-associated protein
MLNAATSEKSEVRAVSKDEIKAGVTARAGHGIVFVVDGMTGTVTPGVHTDSPGGPESPAQPGEFRPEAPQSPASTDDQPDAPPAGKLDAQIVSASGAPQANLEVEFTLPDGTKRAGHTDRDGHFVLDGLPQKGECKLDVPDVPDTSDAGPAGAGRMPYQKGMALAVGSNPVVELPPRVRRAKLSGIHFETNKTFLLPSAMTGIRQLASLYQSFGALSLLVTGHTDTVGDADYNRGLSVERAESIAAYLTDDVDAWMASYKPKPHSAAWGVREDQLMLSTLPQGGAPFYAGRIDGVAGGGTTAAYKQFQAAKGISQSGRGDEATRRALITDYMAIDGTSLPQGAKAVTHGCGLTHLAEPTGPNVPNEANRRVEMFLFESEVSPEPQTPCPSGGCAEFAQWTGRSSATIDLDQPSGRLDVTVVNARDGKPLDGAEVHAAGIVAADALSKGGRAAFDDLIPGHYRLIADLDGFEAFDLELDVAPGPQPAAIALEPLPPVKIKSLSARPITPDEANKLQKAS